jgi:AraC-like DNA-binding protein
MPTAPLASPIAEGPPTCKRSVVLQRLLHELAIRAPSLGTMRTPIPGLWTTRLQQPVHDLRAPVPVALQVLIQGHQHAQQQPDSTLYRAGQCLLVDSAAAFAPCPGGADTAEFLCLWLELLPEDLDTLSDGVAWVSVDEDAASHSLEHLESVCRLLAMWDKPRDLRVLSPLVRKELIYRALGHPGIDRLVCPVPLSKRVQMVQNVIDWLCENCGETVPIADLARRACMSPSSFYKHFRDATGMSPVQFQKRERLREARRLMMAERVNAATAAYEVGYGSPSHFNRDYVRAFGAPPVKDVARLRATAARSLNGATAPAPETTQHRGAEAALWA